MKAINGVKVFEVGDCNSFYAENKDEAIKRANEMFGEGFVGPNGDITLEEVREYTDEEFNKGKIVSFGDSDQPLEDENGEYIKISCEEHLKILVSENPKAGHFSTTEW